MDRRLRQLRAKLGGIVAGLLPLLGNGGCVVAPRMAVTAQRYRIDIRLDPQAHTMVGRTTMDLVRTGGEASEADGPVAVELLIHPNLRITGLRAAGAKLRSALVTRAAPVDRTADDDANAAGDSNARRHVVFLEHPADAMTLFVEYRGKLYQDVAAGEVEGEIHNFEMQAHVGEDGVYLADGYWYPQPYAPEDSPTLSDFTLVVGAVPGFEFAAAGERATDAIEDSGRVSWRSPFPLEEMTLVGGPHEIHETQYDGKTIRLHLKPEQAAHAEGLFEATRRNLDRYQPLIGEYPAAEYSIVDNFFSSGFAFPTFTLLSSAVIDMGKRSQTAHGYLDHEMLHSWWGNGIHVDPRDGNWCEALASYGANYYGYVLDDDKEETRRKRRNFSHFLSRIKPEKDKPLGTYGQKDGCGRKIAYDKGAAVFHMLATTMGQDSFWSAMRRLTADYVGEFASWETIRQVCEKESGKDLGRFFDQWVRGGGAPELAVTSARYDSSEQSLTLAITQGDKAFALEVPIRVHLASGAEDVVVSIDQTQQEVTAAVKGLPKSVELDPDYHIFRRVPPQHVLPTTASTRYGDAFTCVLPRGEIADSYGRIRGIFESSFEPHERIMRTVEKIEGDALAERCALILGDAVRDPYVAAFLSAVEFPVRWTDEGFSFEDVDYTDDGDAILCTVTHPGVPGGGVTVVYANSESAIPSPFVVPMYDRSVVIFRDGRAVLRRDLEHREVVPVDGS